MGLGEDSQDIIDLLEYLKDSNLIKNKQICESEFMENKIFTLDLL